MCAVLAFSVCVKVHAYIIGYLRSQMPSMMGKEKAQKKLTAELAQVFRSVMKQHNLAPGDFPDLEPFRAKLVDTQFIKFPRLKVKMLEDLDEVGCSAVQQCCRRL
ncbi:unnamed protein product [Laminaria digitata]